MNVVARRFRERMPISVAHKPIHLYAIANSGVAIASAILADRAFGRSAGRGTAGDDLLTILTPGKYEYIPHDIDRALLPLLVDNSVNSGCTIAEIVNVMRANHYPVNQMITLVDYEDSHFVLQQRQLRDELGVTIIGLFTAAELDAGFGQASWSGRSTQLI